MMEKKYEEHTEIDELRIKTKEEKYPRQKQKERTKKENELVMLWR